MKKLGLTSIARSRAMVMLATLFYGYAIQYSHANYLHPEWGYFGFSYRAPGTLEILIMAVLLAAGSILLPTTLARPSSIIVLLLFVVVYVPTIVITLGLDVERVELYGPSLGLLGLAFMIVCIGARRRLRTQSVEPRIPGDVFCVVVLALWAICCAILIYKYHSVMSLVGLDDLYDQRAAGASTSLVIGYVQTYFSNVLSPALIALGLFRRRWWMTALGVAGCLIMFMIAAQKTIIVLPLAVFAVFFALKLRSGVLRTSSFLLIVLGAAVTWMSTYYVENLIVSLASTMIVFRTLGLPGLTFSQYYDLFSGDGFTWWSHIKGLNLLIPAPQAYLSDPAWPNLGYMIGDRLYGSIEYNANANLFSGDGIAAAGALGVAVIGIVFAFWVSWLDRTSRGWNRNFAILVILPIALSLTNGHFFTTLLSFGGLFWMLTFYLYKPGR